MCRFMEALAADTYTRSILVANILMRRLKIGIMSINHVGGSVVEAPLGGVESLDGYLITKRVSFKY